MLLAPVLIVAVALLDHSSCGGQVTPGGPIITGQGCAAPIGPGGQAVTDSYYLVHQSLGRDGTITARVTSLTSAGGPGGLPPWSKAGLIISASTRPGSAYAAMMVTAGHGVRMQYDYTGDITGLAGAVSPASPRWLRLSRSGATITGYDSADGVHWTKVGTVHLPGLPATVPAGLFAASPGSSRQVSQSITGSSAVGALSLATARFDQVSLGGAVRGTSWTGAAVGGAAGGQGFRQDGGTFSVTGTGDIAPLVPGVSGAGAGGTDAGKTLLGAFAGLIAVIVVASMFMTAEYRRKLITATFAATPARGRVLAAKATVIGGVAFAAGLAGGAVALPLGEALLRSNGNFIMPVTPLTQARLVIGTAAVLAVAAVLALAVGTILRSGAAAITALVVTMVLPYVLATALPVLPAPAAGWLLRVTPAAGFAVQQTLVRYPQVAAAYTPQQDYYPLPPWAGLAVLCGFAALAMAVAVVSLRSRDA
ncbi:MAG: hypothetical protein M0030_14245 [Actinomycetota bacterium]|nr:hypothetical protein [Actinomycetota bacterium]